MPMLYYDTEGGAPVVCLWDVKYWTQHPQQHAALGIDAYSKCECPTCTKEQEYEDALRAARDQQESLHDPFEGYDF